MGDADPTYDLYSADAKRDPHPTYAAMRRDAPIHRQLAYDGTTPAWYVTRYADVDAMLRDQRFVRDRALTLPPEERPEPTPLQQRIDLHMGNLDGPDHRRLRQLVSLAFTPKRVADLRPRIEAIAAEFLVRLKDAAARQGGHADLITEFSFPLPTTVILELLGVPLRDRDRVRPWTNAAIQPPSSPEEREASVRLLTEFADYLDALFEERREDPQDDLITALVTAEQDGDRLSRGELSSTVILLIVAGHETTVSVIANGVLQLSRRPTVRDALAADPTGIPRMVEELLRFDGSFDHTMVRWATEDVTWEGQRIRRGEPVFLVLGSANRDADRFEDPDRFDPSRDPNPHIAFARGPHFCLGAPLARLETEIAFRALLTELPGLRVAVPESELRYRPLPHFRALEALPVRWDGSDGGGPGR